MVLPNVYTVTPEENDNTRYLVGEQIMVTIGKERTIPVMLVANDNGQLTVCADYFEQVCEICSRTECYFNPLNSKER